MRSSVIAVFVLMAVASFVPRGAEAKKEEKAGGQPKELEQCQCDAMAKCREETQKKQQPCIEKCRSKLRNRHWDQEMGQRCFEFQPQNEHHKCMHEVHLKTCALEPGVMLARNETMPWGRRRHHRRPRDAGEEHENDVNEDEHPHEADEEDAEEDGRQSHPHRQHRAREHNKRAFYAFMRRHFGKSGNAFVRCMQTCGKHRVPDQCPHELNCGLKRLPRAEFRELTGECHKLQKPRRFEVCTCLKDAGMSRLDCTFGRQKNKPDSKEAKKDE
ncbi:hypothetical protein M3Y99_01131800 [Aphelenchoides fujianensis]|nr:hypothetical protein M3Y99_01131800 [Aphelenchoides fujianensis]